MTVSLDYGGTVMGRNRKLGDITIKDEDMKILKSLASSQTAEHRQVQRAKIILLAGEGFSNAEISAKIGVHRNTVSTYIKKYLSAGLQYALSDSERSGKPNLITDEEKAFITNIACTKPKELGQAAELWTYRLLRDYIREHCQENGYSGLKNIAHTTVRSILESNEIKPNKMNYYLVKKDPEFQAKMHDVLVIYKQIEMCFDESGNLCIDMDAPKTVTISYDEKPGIQALKNIAPDLPPTIGHGSIGRDYEYKRLGTVSLLAGLDLLTGTIIPSVSDTHKSSDFVAWLKKVDALYPEHDTIRLILDNHSAHTSKETMAYLETRPGRFAFVFTPKHGSWLNLIESFFSKMTRQCLKGMRVESKQELVDRIYQYCDEVNAAPVQYHWTYKMDEISIEEVADSEIDPELTLIG